MTGGGWRLARPTVLTPCFFFVLFAFCVFFFFFFFVFCLSFILFCG